MGESPSYTTGSTSSLLLLLVQVEVETDEGELMELIVEKVVVRYKMDGGKYVRDHHRLDCTKTGRYFINRMLNDLITSSK